jgi:C-methyltransferase C-terminal domain/Putative zinc binding domain/Methyltransferase domain
MRSDVPGRSSISPAPKLADVVRRTTCRVCEGTDLELILQLGPTPLANAFLESPAQFADERWYPLDVFLCGRCRLMQLLDVVDPEALYRHYLYVTGTSTTMAAHNQEYARTLTELLQLGADDLVVEVAANDGSLLRCFAAHGVRMVGIDPARNLAMDARASHIETIEEFFSAALARELRAEYGPAKLVTANNVLAHVDDARDFLLGCRELVADDGLITVEVPHVGALLERVEFDTIYHEHLSYFSIGALLRLAESAGLTMVRVDRLPIHGGSLRLYLSRQHAGQDASVHALQAWEAHAGLADGERYRTFAAEVLKSRDALIELLTRLEAQGHRVAGYGAPAKGNTLLNFCRIDTGLLDYTVDRNARKVGLYTPGMHIPVRDISALVSDVSRPDYLLVLPWNIADEIIAQQHAYRQRGGKFIIPVPHAEVL